jgi:hypothetical protein
VCRSSCLLQQSCLFTVPGGISPPPSLQHSGSPTLFAMYLFLLLIIQFLFFSLGGSRSVQGAMLICPRVVCGNTTCCLAHLVCVFQAIWALASGGTGALLVSLFNVKWRCYAWAGGVEESKFCLFSVFFPVGCISSVAPRFYFRKHAFCFFSLATILESLNNSLNVQVNGTIVVSPDQSISAFRTKTSRPTEQTDLGTGNEKLVVRH